MGEENIEEAGVGGQILTERGTGVAGIWHPWDGLARYLLVN